MNFKVVYEMRKEKNKKEYINGLLCFTIIIYICILLNVIIFKTLASPIDLFTGNHPTMRSINVISFKEIWNVNASMASNRRNILGNIILFVPLGILLETLLIHKKNNIVKNLLVIILISFSFELMQFIFAIGVSDINDLILNTLGGVIGILIYQGMIAVFKEEKVKSFISIAGAAVGVLIIIMTVLLTIANNKV
jgi:glycopeptide antibiotics resistance protein